MPARSVLKKMARRSHAKLALGAGGSLRNETPKPNSGVLG